MENIGGYVHVHVVDALAVSPIGVKYTYIVGSLHPAEDSEVTPLSPHPPYHGPAMALGRGGTGPLRDLDSGAAVRCCADSRGQGRRRRQGPEGTRERCPP